MQLDHEQTLYVNHLEVLGIPATHATMLVRKAWPRVEVMNAATTEFRVTATPIASTLGCIISGDLNAAAHTKEQGFTQTLAIIGMCAAVASRTKPGFRLAKILPDISFKYPIPLGHPVLMRTTLKRARGAVVWIGLEGWLDTEGRPVIFTPRELLMVRVHDDTQ